MVSTPEHPRDTRTMTALPRGILTALVTPVTSAGTLDHEALDRIVTRVLRGGVVGLSPCGSTGEGARLSPAQRREVTQRVRALAPDVPVIPGVPVTALSAAREELAELATLGASAALVAPPSYYPATDAEVVTLYETLAETSPVPLVLYDIPMFTGVKLTVSVISRLARHPQIIGLKDSSRDMESLLVLLMALSESTSDDDETCAGEFRVYTGTDTLLAASADAGVHGAITASSNLVPRLGVDILAAVHAGERVRAAELQQHLTRVVNTCRRGTPPAGWKAAMHVAGVCGAGLVPPAPSLDDDQIDALRAGLRALQVLPDAV